MQKATTADSMISMTKNWSNVQNLKKDKSQIIYLFRIQ